MPSTQKRERHNFSLNIEKDLKNKGFRPGDTVNKKLGVKSLQEQLEKIKKLDYMSRIVSRLSQHSEEEVSIPIVGAVPHCENTDPWPGQHRFFGQPLLSRNICSEDTDVVSQKKPTRTQNRLVQLFQWKMVFEVKVVSLKFQVTERHDISSQLVRSELPKSKHRPLGNKEGAAC